MLLLATNVAFGQDEVLSLPVSINVIELPLVQVLQQIDDQTDLSFAYSATKIPGRALVTYNVFNASLGKVLTYLSKTYHFRYELLEKQIVLLPITESSPLVFTLSGYISDTETGESLIGATILADNIQAGAITNGYGYFSLNLPYGEHHLKTSYLGYELSSESIDVVKNTRHNIDLKQASPQLQEIIVQGYEPVNLDLIQTGKVSLAPGLVSDIPAVFGEKDVIKSLELIPGINLQSEGSTFFYVRGGNKDQNLILIDDAPIYNPSHMMGLFSTIMPDAVNSIDVYKSDLPLSKGGRLSSVIDIKTKEGNKNNFSLWGNLGLISTQLGIEGPFKKGRSSYLLTGRLSRIKWIFKQEINDLEKFQFYDLTAKTNFVLNHKNRLYLSFYTGADNFLTTTTGLGWSNINGSVRWNNLISKKLFLNTTVYGSNYEYILYIDRVANTKWRSRIGEVGIKTDFNYFIKTNQELAFGLNINGRTINPGNLLATSTIPEENIVSVKNNLETVFYINHEIKTATGWGLKYGFRASSWTSLGNSFEYTFNENGLAVDTTSYRTGEAYNTYVQLEPRITTSFSLNESSSVKLSYGRTVQNLHLVTNSISPFTSFEVWLPSGPNIRPQSANQISAGYYHLSRLGISFELEAYFKSMNNQIDYVAHAATLLNPTLESELLIGKSNGYGIEFLTKKEEGRLRGLFGYTFSRVRSNFAQINDGKTYNANSDRPHHISLNLTYDIGPRVTLGSNFTYTSGIPFSSPTSFYNFDGNEVPVYEQKNNDRFPAYHRLDISTKFILNRNLEKKFRHSLTVSIYNLYARKNPIFINFNKSRDANGNFEVPTNLLMASRITSRTFLYRFTPSFSYQFRF